MADHVQAAQMLLSYKRGAISRDQVMGLLCNVCELTNEEAVAAITYTDKMPIQYLMRQEHVWFESMKQVKH
jgi:hypothetical protein